MIVTVLLTFVIAILIAAIAIGAEKKKNMTISSDGHVVPPEEDLTYRERTHYHRDNPLNKEFGPQYIVHNEPETGYVILNGVKRKLTDCRNL